MSGYYEIIATPDCPELIEVPATPYDKIDVGIPESSTIYYAPSLIADFSAGSIGCFSNNLYNLRIRWVNCLVRHLNGTTSKISMPYRFSQNPKYAAVYSKVQQYKDSDLCDKTIQILFAGLVEKINESAKLTIIGAPLKKNFIHHTANFVQYLIDNKLGNITCSPYIINPTHFSYDSAESNRYCQAWFWVPPAAMSYTLPAKITTFGDRPTSTLSGGSICFNSGKTKTLPLIMPKPYDKLPKGILDNMDGGVIITKNPNPVVTRARKSKVAKELIPF